MAIKTSKNALLVYLIGMTLSGVFFLIWVGVDRTDTELFTFLKKKWPLLAGMATVFFSTCYYLLFRKNRNVQDVDERTRSGYSSEDNCIDNLFLAEKTDFNRYFKNIIILLVNKSKDADEKGSILLDKGLSYSRNGIVFYVLTIIIWQYLSYITGFKEVYIYGIVSCTAIFIFMQFLSAWSLKQYRAYTDTAAYLLRIKTIMDRYYLAYLAITQESNRDVDKTKVLDMLEKEIQWPDTYLLKNKEVGFAREAMETMTMMAQSMRKEVQNVAKKSESKPKGV